MTVTRHGAFRAASVVSTAQARDKLKRRDKPYKTEKSKVLAKKRRIQFETSYKQNAPRGYVFLPVGTPDLAERCKELSRLRNMPVNVVNAAPKSNKQMDPNKVSHHIQRIGYHFQGEIVEKACEELGYVPYEDRFVKQSDLAKRNQDSTIGRLLTKYGAQRPVRKQSAPEDLEIVRAAIKELFPKIPTADLNQIVKHAWEEGTGRVGGASELDLPRRVQLATIARIRHTYTDYDRLLRAFDWAYARQEVEPACLAKLVEWRGEQDAEDNELEEIVRETIVIDDDDDDGFDNTAAEGTDTDDTGNVSDTSVEISHRPAALEDLRMEDPNERAHRYMPRYRPVLQNIDEGRNAARAKIEAFRRQPPALPQAPYATHHGPTPGSNFKPIYIPPTNGHTPRDRIVVDGQVLQLVSPGPANQPQYHQAQQPAHYGNNVPYIHTRAPQPVLHAQGGSAYRDNVVQHGSSDQPVPSIEPGSPWQRNLAPQIATGPGASASTYHSRPVTPDDGRSGKRQRVFMDLTQPSPTYGSAANGAAYPDARLPPHVRNYRGDVVDLTTPPRPRTDMLEARPEIVRVVSSGDARYVLAPREQPQLAGRPDSHANAQPQSSHQYFQQGHERFPAQQAPAEYDPLHPNLVDTSREDRTAALQPPYQPVYEERLPVNPAPQAYQPAQPVQPKVALPRAAYQQPIDLRAYHAAYPGQSPYRLPPAPVHGAPAPVQQMPRGERNRTKEQYVPMPQYAAPAASQDGQAMPEHRAYSVGQYYAG